MQISICMMVKDEQKNIRRCLDSITPILKNIKSELIVIDTGSEDDTVEIVKEYTDKIFFHKWEDDFSTMRNKSISYAKGKWILIIDADEEIIDCNNIISFINSIHSENYNTGLIDVKNIETLCGKSQYAMLKSPRVFRNDSSFHYKGIVHNTPCYKEPTVDLETTILHYGYLEENKDIANKKFLRTSTLLKEALQKEPGNIYYLFQLSVTYRNNKDINNAYETIKKAYLLSEDLKDKNQHKYVYYQMALCCIDIEEYETAKEICKEGLKVDNEYVDLMFYFAKTQGLTGEYEKSIETYNKYICLCKNYNKLNINLNVSLGMYTLGRKDEATADIIKIHFKLGNFNNVFNYVFHISEEEYILNLMEIIIKSAMKTEKLDYLKRFYEEKISGTKERENKFYSTLNKYADNNIYKLFSGYDNDYSKLYFLTWKYNENDSALKEILNDISFDEDFNNLKDCFGDVIYYKLKVCSSLSELLLNVLDKNINRYLKYILKKYEDFNNRALNYIKHFGTQNNFNDLRINRIICKYLLLIDEIDNSQYEKIFKYYLDIGTKYMNYVYNKTVIEGQSLNLYDDEVKFFIYMNMAIEHKDKKELYIKNIRNALSVYPYMKKGIEILKDELLDNDVSKKNELEQYKVQVKSAIKELIDNNRVAEAGEVISEYEKIVSDDVEVQSMKSIVAIMNGSLKEAEKILKNTLSISKNDFELLYNLGYVYELMNQNYKAIIEYKKARKAKFYDGEIRSQLDSLIENIYTQKKHNLIKEKEDNRFYYNLEKIQNILFIDFDLKKEVNDFADKLDGYGINVDIAYSNVRPDANFYRKDLPFRKTIGITNIDDFIEYINYYDYDVVQVFNVPINIKNYLKENYYFILDDNKLLDKKIEDTINDYVINKCKKKLDIKKENNSTIVKEKLTVVIPTYNRPEYLYRVLSYFHKYKSLKPKILILDSSCEDMKSINRETVKKFNYLKITYSEFDSEVDFYRKLNEGLVEVSTQYIAMCADDDFLVEEGLIKSLQALEDDKSLYSVKGKNMFFLESMRSLTEYDFFEGLYELQPVERLKTITQGFVPSLIYQVFRIEKFKQMYLFLGENKNKLPCNNTFQEYLFYFMVIMSGKIGKINIDLNIRDKSVPREIEFKNFPHAVIDGTFNENYQKFCEFLVNYALKLEENDKSFRINIQNIFCDFLINFLQVPKEYVTIEGGVFNIKKLEIGMRKSWVWPKEL